MVESAKENPIIENQSSSLDILSPEEEAHFDRGIDFEALYKELQNIDPSETDLDNNKNCANIK